MTSAGLLLFNRALPPVPLSMRLPASADRLFAIFLLALTVARLVLLFTSQGNVHGDEATVGVMALRLLKGGEWPVTAYNEPYNGGAALMAWLAAIPFSLLGPSERVLKALPLLFSLLAVLLVYVLVRGARGPWPALAAAVTYGTAVSLLRWSFDARGAYVECQALTPLAFWLLHRRPSPGAVAVALADLALGMVCGFGFYLLGLFAPAALTCLVFVLLRRASVVRGAVLWLLGFAAGSFPVWLIGMKTPPAPRGWETLPAVLWRTVTDSLPRALSDRTLYGTPPFRWIPNGMEAAFLALMLACVLVARWPALRAWVRSGTRPPPPLEAILGVHLLVYLAVLSLYPRPGRQARYLLFAEPTMSVLAGLGAYEALARPGRGWRLGAAVLMSAVLAERASQYVRVLGDDALYGASGRSDPAVAPAIVRLLQERGCRTAHIAHWDLRWRVELLSRGTVRTQHLSFAWLNWLVSADYARRQGRYALVLDRGQDREVILPLLARDGLPFQLEQPDGFDVYLIGVGPSVQ